MNNWKSQLDARIQARKEEDARRKQEAQKRAEAARKQRAAEEYAKNLKRSQQRFKCHICGKPSTGPGTVNVSNSTRGQGYWGGGGSDQSWDVPAGLTRCGRCKKWACDNHIHHIGGLMGSICMNCASRM